jgi:hypothetical protein
VLRTDLRNHRRSTEPELMQALGEQDPLALAESCSRTLAVAYAVGRRLLPAADLEALLLAVYGTLWDEAPVHAPLERWVRSRACELAIAELRERGSAPAAPSVHALAPDLPEPSVTYLDTTERALASLSEEDRVALLRAHDAGIPSTEQGEGADRRIIRALRVLADPAATDEDDEDDGVDVRLGDWVLGLLPTDEAAALEQEVAADPARSAQVQALRRGRRRIEGLPPTPDLGPRLLAAVLSGGTTAGRPPEDAVDDAPADNAPDDGASPDAAAAAPVGPAGPAAPAAPAPAASAWARDATEGESRADDASADAGWGATESGPAGAAVSETSFDDTPPEGLPTASASALDQEAEGGDGSFRLSDLFDDGEDDGISSVFDEHAEPSPGWAGADATTPEAAAEDHRDAGPEPAAAWSPDEDDEGWGPDASVDDALTADAQEGVGDDDEATTLPERRRPSAGVRLLQAIGVLLLLAAGVGLGLFLGQILLSVLRG